MHRRRRRCYDTGMSPLTTRYTHDTVPTTYVEADGARFAYRRFGRTEKTPVVFIQHFRGTMDNRGIGATNGIARATVDDMAGDTA